MFHMICLDYAVDDSSIPWDFELVCRIDVSYFFFLQQLTSFEAVTIRCYTMHFGARIKEIFYNLLRIPHISSVLE